MFYHHQVCGDTVEIQNCLKFGSTLPRLLEVKPLPQFMLTSDGNAGTGLPGLPADARPARLHLGEVGACQQVLVRQAEGSGRCRLVEAGFTGAGGWNGQAHDPPMSVCARNSN